MAGTSSYFTAWKSMPGVLWKIETLLDLTGLGTLGSPEKIKKQRTNKEKP
jgi:hypothetical protein